MLALLVCLPLLTAASPISNSSNEEVAGVPRREGKFFIGLIADTYWCGSGNVARSQDEFGKNWKVDVCCHDHDYCEHSLEPGEHNYGLINEGKFTASMLVKVGYSLSLPMCFDIHIRVVCSSVIDGLCRSYRIYDEEWKWTNSTFKNYHIEHQIELEQYQEEQKLQNQKQQQMVKMSLYENNRDEQNTNLLQNNYEEHHAMIDEPIVQQYLLPPQHPQRINRYDEQNINTLQNNYYPPIQPLSLCCTEE